MIQRFLLSLMFAMCATPAIGQITFTVTGSDGSAYPTMRVFFDAKDRNGIHIGTFAPSDFTVVEDGITRPVLSVSCPPARTPPVSITLTIDYSYSMSIDGRMTNAKTAALQLVRALSFPPAQMGIIRFDDNTSIYRDYTTDTTALVSDITALQATGGGTDFLGAFLDPGTGSIDYTKDRPGTRYIIFMTDGAQVLSNAQETQIINAARAANIRIYTLTLSAFTINLNLRRIATQTGGQWFEDVTTEQKARDAFKQITDYIYYYDPCELTYRTDGCETSRLTTVTLRKNNSTATQTIPVTVPASAITSLTASTPFVDFGRLTAGSSGTADILLTARNGAVNVQSIGATPSAFQIVSTGGSAPPFTLASGESRVIRVRFTAPDTSRVTGRLVVQNDAPCQPAVALAGGAINPEPLVLLQPNGGEVFFAGTSTTLRWRGVPSSQQVALDYSTDAGSSWLQISPNAYSLSTPWVVANTPSTTCLGLVYTPERRTASKDAAWLPTQPSEVTALSMAASGGMLAAALADGRLKLYDAESGALMTILSSHTGRANAVAFSPDIRFLASGGNDGLVKIWAPATGSFLRNLTGHSGQVHSVAFSADGSLLASADQSSVILWRTADWSQVWRVASGTTADGALAIDPGNRWVASANGNNVSILSITNGSVTRTLTGHTGAVRSLSVTADGQTLASGSEDRSIRIWNTFTWTLVRPIAGHTNGIQSVVLSQSGMYALTASRDRTVRIFDVRTATIKQTFNGHTGEVADARCDWRTGLIASAGADRGIRVWGYAMPLADRSDSLWAIIAPNTTLEFEPAVFDSLLCADSYSDGQVVVRNKGNQPITISSGTFTGPSASAFSFGPGFTLPPVRTLQPEDTLVIPLRFAAIPAGDHSATLQLQTDAPSLPSLDIPLSGRKDSAAVFLLTDSLDTGQLYWCTTPVTLPWVVANTGTVEMRIDSLLSDAPGLTTFDPPLPHVLLAGETDTLYVTVHPSSTGVVNARLTLGASPCPADLHLRIRSELAPSAPQAIPTALAFPYAAVGDTTTQQVTVRNPTASPMRIERADLTGTAFEIEGTVAFPLDLAPFDSVIVTIRFLPTSEGTATGEVVFHSSAPCSDSVAVSLDGSSSRKAEIAVRPGTFPARLCPDDTPVDMDIECTNTGGELLTISGLSLGGTHPGDFAILTATPLPITPGAQATVRVRFSPRGIGDRSATLTVTSNAAQNPTVLIPLSGRKDSANFILSSSASALGIVHACDLPAVRTTVLRNTGTVPMRVTADVSGLPAFVTLTRPPFPLTVQAGDSVTVEFTIASAQPGTFDATVLFAGTPCAPAATWRITGEQRASTPVLSDSQLDFGMLGAGTSAERSVTITNPSGAPMQVDALDVSPSSSALTRIEPPSLPVTIPPGGTLTVRYRYAPVSTDTMRSGMALRVSTPCSDSGLVTLRGSALGAFAEFALPTLSAEIGTRVRIPIRMTRAENLELTGARSYRAEVSFDRTILWPERIIASGATTTMTTSTQGSLKRVVATVEYPAAPGAGTAVELECLVMLGTTDTTALHFDSVQWLTGIAGASGTGGSFTALGVCEAGGRRFMASPSGAAFTGAAPNPFNPSTDLLFTLPEAAPVRIDIVDVLGRHVRTVIDASYPAGSHRVRFDGTGLPSGVYTAILRAGATPDTYRLMLAK